MTASSSNSSFLHENYSFSSINFTFMKRIGPTQLFPSAIAKVDDICTYLQCTKIVILSLNSKSESL